MFFFLAGRVLDPVLPAPPGPPLAVLPAPRRRLRLRHPAGLRAVRPHPGPRPRPHGQGQEHRLLLGLLQMIIES